MVADSGAIGLSTAVGSDYGVSSAPTPLLTLHAGVPAACRLMDWRDFHSELQRAAIAATQTGAPLSLLMLERVESNQIDQPCGSEVAASTVAALAAAVRAAVGERGVLARYSEGRLAVILIDTDLGEAVGRAERIADQVLSPSCRASDTVDLEMTAAIGIAQFQDDESLGQLIQWTAEALKQARTHRGLAMVADHTARQRPSRLLRHVRPA
ncbi:MAG TPA: diguanylate cyclase [Geminicoccaceae bacterium]|nr:diguanylate cyclase [Geminicoccaceae bacterium]